mgnify:CR=1 FL=1
MPQRFPVPSKRANAKEWKKFQRLSYNQSMALLLDECNDYMTRWFCGHGPECRDERDPGKALDVAKRHVRDAYAHVGVLEDLPNTAQLFRLLLPDFLAFASRHCSSRPLGQPDCRDQACVFSGRKSKLRSLKWRWAAA